MSEVRTSIVIPAFNREWCIRDAMESALGASSPMDEIVVVDDGSKDATLAIMMEVASRAPDRVRVLRHPGGVNRGISATRNLGIRAARGRYLAFVDSDDLLAAHRLAAAPDWLDRYPSMLAAIEPYQICWFVQPTDNRVEFHLTKRGMATSGDMLRLMLWESIYWHTSSITIRRKALELTGAFDTSFRVGEDTALWLRLASTGRVGVAQSETAVSTVRRHQQHSWAPDQPLIGHRIHLRGLTTALRWALSRIGEIPHTSVVQLRERVREFTREICADRSLPVWFRLEAWGRAVAADPSTVLDRSVNANLARLILLQSTRQ